MKKIPKKFFIFEIANNHMGDINHAFNIIEEFSSITQDFKEFTFAFKLQFRNLDTFIHPDYLNRNDLHYIKRFQETKLYIEDFKKIIQKIRERNHLVVITAFDNDSISTLKNIDYDFLKIASCSFNDWPLLEDAISVKKPIILSTAGANISTVDQVVAFMLHRKKEFALLHCVAEYPTNDISNFNMNRIDLFKKRYSSIRVGYSTHELPDQEMIINNAVSKGADIFEKHIALPTKKYSSNLYSSSPDQTKNWLKIAYDAFKICGETNQSILKNKNEQKTLNSLKRGAYAKNDINKNQKISLDDVFFAFPSEENQFFANDFSKHNIFKSNNLIKKNSPINNLNTEKIYIRKKIDQIADACNEMLRLANISIPGDIDLEISHHYGIEKFDKYGLVILTLVNREYCKKLLICFPGQTHPEQYHKKKEETFCLLHGDLQLIINNKKRKVLIGEVITIELLEKHSFSSENGAIIEEISSTHFIDDSFYSDKKINSNKNRKTILTDWLD